MKASQLFLRCLEAEGVEFIFGIPGEENADVMMSLLDSPIRFIICRHEQGAAFMADLYGRMTGNPGVCLGTLGPGATNLATGVANANMDNSPVVVITGQGATTRLHKESHQIMNAVEMFQPMTKWAASIYDERNIPEVVRKAFKVARAEKPGAVHVELPEDIAKNEVDERPIVAGLKVRRPIADDKTILGALDLIAGARTPVVLAGNGCVRTRVSVQLLRFIEATGIYVAMTFMGKGAISDRHPQSLYAAGLGARDHVSQAFEEADLVIAVGYDLVEWHPSRWNRGVDKKILHLDFRPRRSTRATVRTSRWSATWPARSGRSTSGSGRNTEREPVPSSQCARRSTTSWRRSTRRTRAFRSSRSASSRIFARRWRTTTS